MPTKTISNHPALGGEITYTDRWGKKLKGTVTAVRSTCGFLFDSKTLQQMPSANLIELRIKPANGKREFWSRAMFREETK